MLFPYMDEADLGGTELGSEVEGLGGRRGGGMGGGTAGGGILSQTSNATKLAFDGCGGTGGTLGSSVVGEVPRRGETVPVPLSRPPHPPVLHWNKRL